MRKKSHLSVAKFLAEHRELGDIANYRKSFYLGSILPDCTPSFLTRRHTIDETMDILESEIGKITERYNPEKGMNRYNCRHLGIVTHYIADYFTFPHNDIFEGNIKQHCSYEKELKFAIRKYVRCKEASENVREQNGTFESVKEIVDFVHAKHKEYVETVQHKVSSDCRYIVELCFSVVDAIFQLLELKAGERQLKALPCN
ncbi:MAG: zinc dependent phospholipase C family protein [Lachnospiraceae bacterium]|nr:zinc dependent phospholipase C family protein [Lachnospiraceae bacterium]